MINPHSRRRFLQYGTFGLGNLGLGMMLQGAAPPSSEVPNPLAPKAPHFAPKAKRLIHIFLNGGMSHVDTFDPKPALNKYAGQAAPGASADGAQNGRGVPFSVCVPPVWAKRPRDQRNFPQDRRVRGRSLRGSLHVYRHPEPRALFSDDELRLYPAGAPQHGLVAYLRAGLRKSEPARVHRAVPQRPAHARRCELALGFSARHLSGHAHRYQPETRGRSGGEYLQRFADARRTNARNWTRCRR